VGLRADQAGVAAVVGIDLGEPEPEPVRAETTICQGNHVQLTTCRGHR
jgi:hypothetical protein